MDGPRQTKYVIVSGGVMSGIGKGVVASSTGMLLRAHGFRVTSIKIDPYLNIDAGTMSPYEHGEVYILDDGGEVDLDLGNYERFVDLTLTRDNNITTGKIYSEVISKERRGDYLGKTVQVVPHICNEIQDTIQRVAQIPTDGGSEQPDICVIELGGTVGDIESMPFIEALHQFQFRVGKKNFCLMHVTLVPVVSNEQKTKPTQRSVSELRSAGLAADMVICRCATPIEKSTQQKISLFCNVGENDVIGVHDVSNLYRVPLILVDQHLPEKIINHFGLQAQAKKTEILQWRSLAAQMDTLNSRQDGVKIVIAGKYTGLTDAYHSVVKGIQHAALHTNTKVIIQWIETSQLEKAHQDQNAAEYDEAWSKLRGANGILVPGGYGNRGIEGKILVAEYARTNNIPYFGICLGMQIAVIEFARHKLGWKDANSEEFDRESKHQVVIFMPEGSKTFMGGTMRLGARSSHFKKPCTLSLLYEKIWGKSDKISERHRHRYEVNPKLAGEIESHGLTFVAQDDTGARQEIIELEGHPYFVGVQYHPEMKTRPTRPSPPFVGLVLAAAGELEMWREGRKVLGLPSHK